MAETPEKVVVKKSPCLFNRFIITNATNQKILFFEEIHMLGGDSLNDVLKVLQDFSKNPSSMQDGKIILLSTPLQRVIVLPKDTWLFSATMVDKPMKDDYRFVNNIVKRIVKEIGPDIVVAVTQGRKDLRDIIRAELGLCSVDAEMEVNGKLRDLIAIVTAENGDPTFLKEGFRMDIDPRKEFLADMETVVQKWLNLIAKVKLLDLPPSDEQFTKLQRLLKDPLNVDDLLKAFVILEKKAKAMHEEQARQEAERAKQMEQYVQALNTEIQSIEGMGFRVTALRRLLATGDLESTRNSINALRNNAEHLTRMRAELDAMDTTGYEWEVENLHTLMIDPVNLMKAQTDFEELKVIITTEKNYETKLSALATKLCRWEAEKYRTSFLYDVLTQDIAVIEETFNNFEKSVIRMKAIETEMKGLDRSVAPFDYDRLSNILRDISKINEAEQIIAHLKASISFREQLDKKLKDWSAEGFNVSSVKALRDKDFMEYQRLHEEFESKIGELKWCEWALKTLKADDFPNEVALIQLMLRDINKVEEVKANLQKLKAKVMKGRKKPEGPLGPPIKDELELLKIIETMPKGLAPTLWGKAVEELAIEIINGTYWESPEGELLVRLGRRWYYGDPFSISTFLRPYKKDGTAKAPGPKRGDTK